MPFWSDEEPTGLELGEGLLLVFLSLVILMVGILSVYLATRRGADDNADELDLSRRSSRHSRRGSGSSRRPRSSSRDEPPPPVQDSSSNDSAPGTPLTPSKRRSKRSMGRNRTPQTDGGSTHGSYGSSSFGINAARHRSAIFGGSTHGNAVGRASVGSMEMRSAHIFGRSFATDEVKSVERYDTFSITQSVGPNTSRDDMSTSHRGSESGSDSHCLDRKSGLIYGLNCALNYDNSASQRVRESPKDDVLEALIGNLMDTRNVSRCLNRRDGLNDGLCNALRDALTDAISDALTDALTDALHDALTSGIAPGLTEGLVGDTSDDLSSIMSDIGSPSPKDSITGRKKGQKLSVQLLRRMDNRSDRKRAFKSCLADNARDTASDVGSVDQSSPMRGGRLNNNSLRRDTQSVGRQIGEKVSNNIQQSESGYLSCRSVVQSDSQSKDESEEKLDETNLDESSDLGLGVIKVLKREVTVDRDRVPGGAQRVSRSFGRRCNGNVGGDRKDHRSIGDSAERSVKIQNPQSTSTGNACKCPSSSPKRHSLSAVDEGSYKSLKQKNEQKFAPSVHFNDDASLVLDVKSLDHVSEMHSTKSPDESERSPGQNTDQCPHSSTNRILNSRGKQNVDQKKNLNFCAGECKKKNTADQSKQCFNKDYCPCKAKVGRSASRSSCQNVDQNFGQRVGRSMDRGGDSQAGNKCNDKEGAARPAVEQQLRRRADTEITTGETDASNRPASDASPVPSGRLCPRRRRSLHTDISPCSCIGGRRSRSPSGNRPCKKCGANSRS